MNAQLPIPSDIALLIEKKQAAMLEEKQQKEQADRREQDELETKGQIIFNEQLKASILKVPEWLFKYFDPMDTNPNYLRIGRGWDRAENIDLIFSVPGLAMIAFEQQKNQWRSQTARWSVTWDSEPILDFNASSYWRSDLEYVLLEAQREMKEYQDFMSQYAAQQEECARRQEQRALEQQAQEGSEREDEIRNELKRQEEKREEEILLDTLRSDPIAITLLKALVMVHQERSGFTSQIEDANNSLYSMEEHWSRKAVELRRQADEAQRHAEEERYRLQSDLDESQSKLKKAEQAQRGW